MIYGHGGDTYKYGRGIIDFSANINPLGMPETVIRAARDADAGVYPDPKSGRLRSAIAGVTGVSSDDIICGNGAAALMFTLAAALRPKLTLIPEPAFSEYERAVKSVGSEVAYYAEDSGAAGAITGKTELVFICSPNNPTGYLIDRSSIRAAVERAAEFGAAVVVDECFNDFLDEPERYSVSGLTAEYKNLIVLRSFTKMYAMPGLRLGYMLCSDRALIERMYSERQPWEISAPAEAAGTAACFAAEHAARTRAYIHTEREYIKRGFDRLGIRYMEPSANFIMFYHRPGLKEKLLKKNILIRSCSDFRGLGADCYRAAVRLHEENIMLIKALEELNG